MSDMLGLRYIAVKQPIETVDKTLKPGELKLITRTKDAYIYENIGAFPRVMSASEWLPADFGRLIKDGRWPKFDPMRAVLLDEVCLGKLPLFEACLSRCRKRRLRCGLTKIPKLRSTRSL